MLYYYLLELVFDTANEDKNNIVMEKRIGMKE